MNFQNMIHFQTFTIKHPIETNPSKAECTKPQTPTNFTLKIQTQNPHFKS